jgi:hypothetical protein
MPCYIPREYMYLDILHVFYTYPKRVQDTFWDTYQIHQDTCILDASLVSHWIHIRIHQDTCILDSSSRYILWYIRIHRDTKSRYMYLGCVMTRYVSEMQDTFGIHARYMYLQGWSRYMRDTSKIHDEIHVSQMHPESEHVPDMNWDMRDTCGIHPRYMMRYMYLKCIQRENMYRIWIETCGIHAGYMRDTCGTRISGVWGYPSAPASRARDTYPRMYPFVSDMYRACILCVMYLRVKIHCILNVSLLYPKCIVKKDTYP